jgi:Fic family protein
MTTVDTDPWSVEALNRGLVGSPYSVPEDPEQRERIKPLVDRLRRVEARSVKAHTLVVSQVRSLLRRNNRIREIYETNKIEGLGPSLAGTAAVLRSTEAQQITHSINRHTLVATLSNDTKTQEVLGMHGAKLLAEDILASQRQGRHLTEVDVRDMHRLVLREHPGAGRYKRFVNEIEGATHEPLFPSDVSGAMHQLISWQNRVRAEHLLPPVVIAATSHAWLTHIHPFEDGNGRIARLLANIVIGAAALPPLIVRSSSDRGQYITALATSDEGGDLAPLVSVFTRVLQRGVAEMEKPKWALRLFDGEVTAQSAPEFDQWATAWSKWLTEFGAAALLSGLRLNLLATPTFSDMERFRTVGLGEALWAAELVDQRSPDRGRVFLVLRRPGRLSRWSERHYPGLFFFYDTGHTWSSMRFARLYARIEEVLVLPSGSAHKTYVMQREGKVRVGTSDAPGYVAEHIATAMRSGLAVTWTH